MYLNGKTVQLLPADGWRALYAGEGEQGSLELDVEPLVGWALVRRPYQGKKTGDDVVGLIGRGSPYIEAANEVDDVFVCYLAPGDEPEMYRRRAHNVYAVHLQHEAEKDELREAGFRWQLREVEPDLTVEQWCHPTTGEWMSSAKAIHLLRDGAVV